MTPVVSEEPLGAAACAYCRRTLRNEYFIRCRWCRATYCYAHSSRHQPARCPRRHPQARVVAVLVVAGKKVSSSANV